MIVCKFKDDSNCHKKFTDKVGTMKFQKLKLLLLILMSGENIITKWHLCYVLKKMSKIWFAK